MDEIFCELWISCSFAEHSFSLFGFASMKRFILSQYVVSLVSLIQFCHHHQQPHTVIKKAQINHSKLHLLSSNKQVIIH